MISISSLFEISFGLLTNFANKNQENAKQGQYIRDNAIKGLSNIDNRSNTAEMDHSIHKNNLSFGNGLLNTTTRNNQRMDEIKNRLNMRSQPNYKSSPEYEKSKYITSNIKGM
jgi:hypothetical protein